MGSRTVIATSGAIVLVLVIGACTDTTGPPIERSLLDNLTLLASVAGDDGTSVEPRILKQADSMPLLETYAVSFWAHRGRNSSATIRYLPAPTAVGSSGDADDNDGDDDSDDDDDGARDAGDATFLSLLVPRGSLKKFPDGRKVRKHDSLLITITVDPVLFFVSLEPSGVGFSAKHPAELFINYAGAIRDFDRDGDEDEIDDLIERQLLKLWSREGDGPWNPIEYEQSLPDRWFLGLLRHFSGHVISW